MYKKIWALFIVAAAYVPAMTDGAETATVTLDLSRKKAIGGVTELDRKKYFGAHTSAGTFHDRWDDSKNYLEDYIEPLFGTQNGSYNMSLGRGFTVGWVLDNAAADTERPGYWSSSEFISQGNGQKQTYDVYKSDFPLLVDETIHGSIAAVKTQTFYPEKPEDYTYFPINENEGTRHAAIADATVNYLRYTSWPKPVYLEVMNECNVKANKIAGYTDSEGNSLWNMTGTEVFDDMCRLHNVIAKNLKSADEGMPEENHVSQIKVGGPTAAWPAFENNNFDIWNRDFKRFIDIAGENMDFYSLHFYDGNDGVVETSYFRRTGGNIEAILDMVDSYSVHAIGERKPIVISEWGLTEAAIADLPTYRQFAWNGVSTENTMVMQFMDRPDRIDKTIPFNTSHAIYENGTGNWTTGMFRFDQDSSQWVEGDIMHYYRLWKNVKGERLHITSSDIDVITHAFLDGSTVYMCINNSQFEEVDITLPALPDVVSATISRSFSSENASQIIEDQVFDHTMPTLQMSSRETVVIAYTLNSPPIAAGFISENDYYASKGEFLREIAANTPQEFTISVGEISNLHSARLNIGIGRTVGSNFTPTVMVNDSVVSYTADMFAEHINGGMTFTRIEIDVPNNDIESDNIITVSFPDSGGHVTTATMTIQRDWNTTTPFTVTFDPGEHGTITDNTVQTVGIGGAAQTPNLTVNSGYSFVNWDTSFDYVTSDITVTAVYSEDAPYTDDLHLRLDANTGAITNGTTITSWENLADGTTLPATGSPQRGIRADNNTSVIRFNGDSYFDLSTIYADTANSPVTAFIVYSRESEQVTTNEWQRMISSVDSTAGSDNSGDGFNIGTGNTVSEIETTIGKANESIDHALNKMCIGANGSGFKHKYFGDISEILIYTRSLSTSEEETVETFLKSKWISYDVAFNAGTNGSLSGAPLNQVVFHAAPAQTPTVTPESGYAFTGWNTTFDSVTSDLNVTALYSPAYTVTFQPGDHGSLTGELTQIVIENGTAEAPNVIPDAAYTFTGWDESLSTITRDIIITAEYELKTYTVTFNAGINGTITSNNAIQTVEYGSSAIEPILSIADGYELTGWDKAFDTVTSNLSITALYNVDLTNNLILPPAFDPAASDSGLHLWLDASFGITAGGDNSITEWINLADPTTTTVTAGSPELVVRNDDMKPVIRFDGSSSLRFETPEKQDSDATVFAVFSRDADSNGGGDWQRIVSSRDSATNSDANGTSFRVSLGSTANEGVYKPRMIYPQSDAVFSSRSLKNIGIGVNASQYTNHFLTGDVSEVLIYDKALSSDEQIAVQEYLKTKWFSYTVTFDGGDKGTIAVEKQTQRVNYKQSATAPHITIENGWNLTGWSVSLDDITEDLNAVAQYSQNLTTVTMSLKQGYNLLSLSVLPDGDNSMPTVLDSIKTNLTFAMDSSKLQCSYDGTWTNTIGNWNTQNGYLINVSAPTTFSVTGISTARPASYTFTEGLNIVPIYTEVDPKEYFASILNQVTFIRDDSGKTMREVDGLWLNGIGNLMPGKAYVIRVTETVPFAAP